MKQRYIKISKYAEYMGYHYRTALRRFHEGKIKGFQDKDTSSIFVENPLYKEERKDITTETRVILYARVSSSNNKASLDG